MAQKFFSMEDFKEQFKKKGNDSLLCMFDVVSKTSKLAIKSDRFIAQIFLCDCCEAYCIPKVTTEDMCYLKMHAFIIIGYFLHNVFEYMVAQLRSL